VNGIIDELLTLLKGEASRFSVAMRTDLSPELPKIMADCVQLQQVFMNLMFNAIEAMENSGGELTVKSELQDGQLQFSVSDKGLGCQWRRWIRSFLRSLLPSRRAAAWGWPSAVLLWSRMAGSCSQAPTAEEAQSFISHYRSRSQSHRPWLTFTVGLFVKML
jgi:siroheme synthase (precorrin-2 oxidase/ferrochelatase)